MRKFLEAMAAFDRQLFAAKVDRFVFTTFWVCTVFLLMGSIRHRLVMAISGALGLLAIELTGAWFILRKK